MVGKLYSIFAFTSIAGMLSIGGLTGYLYFGGKLTSSKIAEITAVLRGEATSQPVSSQPSTQPTATDSQSGRVRSADELRVKNREDQLRRALLERANRDLAAQKDLVDQATQELIMRTEQFDARKKVWAEEQRKLREDVHDEGFERELKYISKLAPRQAKEHLLKTWKQSKPDAVRILSAVNPSAGQRILEQLKTPEELQILHELLEQLRTQDVEPQTAGSRTIQPDANP